ncbi:MAG: hypothetical protein AABW79_01390 [Nanoarchaeota archaeon]
MKNIFSLGFVFAFLAVALLSVSFVSAGAIETPIITKTTPEITSWIADGQTWYRVDVRADASMYNYQVSGFDWRVNFPSYLQLVNSQWPSSGFFYQGLQLNAISNPDRTVTSTSVQGNVGLATPSQAPIGQNAIVASYYFVASPSAPVGQNSFDIPFVSIVIRDASHEVCGVTICSGLPGEIINDPFMIFRMPGNGHVSKLTSVRNSFAQAFE